MSFECRDLGEGYSRGGGVLVHIGSLWKKGLKALFP